MKTNFTMIEFFMALVAGMLTASANADEVVAHPSVTLSADEVKELFLGDKQLAGNVKLIPVDNTSTQALFLAKVLRTDVTKYSARWTKKAFREGLTAPIVKSNDAEAIAFVQATPGAVAYVGMTASGVKVLHKY